MSWNTGEEKVNSFVLNVWSLKQVSKVKTGMKVSCIERLEIRINQQCVFDIRTQDFHQKISTNVLTHMAFVTRIPYFRQRLPISSEFSTRLLKNDTSTTLRVKIVYFLISSHQILERASQGDVATWLH